MAFQVKFKCERKWREEDGRGEKDGRNLFQVPWDPSPLK